MDESKRLRTLLDERGIEHDDNDANTEVTGVRITRWKNGGKREVRYEEWRNGTTRLDAGNVSPEQAIAATVGERNPDGLPIGLTVSNDGNLLNWMGENYVRQDAATVDEESEMYICKRCGVAYELNILDKGFGKPRFCPNCGYREMYQ